MGPPTDPGRAQRVDGARNNAATAPVNLQLTPTDALVRIRGWSLPAPFLPLSIMGSWGGKGTITGAGEVNVPVGQISAPTAFEFPRDINGEEETMKVSLAARGDWTGSVNPLNGEATMQMPTNLRIEASHVRMVDIPWPGGWIYGNIDCSVPLDFGPMVTGTMDPPDAGVDPAPLTEGVPYSASTGQFSVINNSMTIGGFDCSHPDIGAGEVEDELNGAVNIPAPAGRTDARFNLTFLEGGSIIRPKPAIRPSFDWLQGAPSQLALDASGSYAKAGVARYVWDVDGDSKGDVNSASPTLTQSFPTTGPRTVGLRIVDKDGDSSGWVTEQVAVGSEPGAGVPELAPLKIKPRIRRSAPGSKTRFKVRVTNSGGAAAVGVRLCVKGPKGLVKVKPACARAGDIGPGQAVTRRITVKLTRRAHRRKRVLLRFRASDGADAAARAKARIKVVSRRLR